MKEISKLRVIANIGAGQGAPQDSDAFGKEGYSFIRAGDLPKLLGGIDQNELPKIVPEVAEKYKLKLFSKGSVVFAKSGMSCTKGYVYCLTEDSYLVSHLACIHPSKKVIPEYLRYNLMFHKPNKLIKDVSYPSISLTDIGNSEISVTSHFISPGSGGKFCLVFRPAVKLFFQLPPFFISLFCLVFSLKLPALHPERAAFLYISILCIYFLSRVSQFPSCIHPGQICRFLQLHEK